MRKQKECKSILHTLVEMTRSFCFQPNFLMACPSTISDCPPELTSAVSKKLTFSKYFYRFVSTKHRGRRVLTSTYLSGALGAGLAILSRFPIVDSKIHPYSLNGHPMHLSADWFVGKACGSVTVDHPKLGLVAVWNTHFVAAGGEDGPEWKRAHRVTQAYELANRCRESAARGRHVICVGDLNSTPPSLVIG